MSEEVKSVQEQVNEVVAAMVQDESGGWQIPEEVSKDLPEAVLYAATTERRFRDTQGSYTKTRQQLKELETVNSELTQHVVTNATLHLTDEQRDQLEELKGQDIEAWRVQLNKYEAEAKELQKAKIEEFAKKGKTVSEGEARKQAYEDFSQRTGLVLSDEVIETQLPAAYSKKLDSGDWTFDEFLEASEKFLSVGKVVKGAADTPKPTPNLGALPGGSEPSTEAQEGDAIQSYANEVY